MSSIADVSKLTLEEKLTTIGCSSERYPDRLSCIFSIDDEKVLFKIATSNLERTIKSQAISQIENQELLFEIAKKEKETSLITELINKIKVRDHLLFLKKHYIKTIKGASFNRLINEQLNKSNNSISFILED